MGSVPGPYAPPSLIPHVFCFDVLAVHRRHVRCTALSPLFIVLPIVITFSFFFSHRRPERKGRAGQSLSVSCDEIVGTYRKKLNIFQINSYACDDICNEARNFTIISNKANDNDTVELNRNKPYHHTGMNSGTSIKSNNSKARCVEGGTNLFVWESYKHMLGRIRYCRCNWFLNGGSA